MTRRLEQAIEAIKKLPEPEQDAIAIRLLEELDDDQRWDKAFADSADRLAGVADLVRAEIRAGKVRPMNPDDL